MEAKQLAQQLGEIEARNQRVEIDKAWETSKTRTVLIMALTYVVALVWLVLIAETDPFLKAAVPAIGWFLSTLTVQPVKKVWVRLREKQ